VYSDSEPAQRRKQAVDWSIQHMTSLAVLRKQKLMTQRELAAAAGVTIATVNYAEGGLTKPRIVTIRKICRALGVQANEVDEFRRALELPDA
jgi:transcriptional regulator with XRE-family HTH domain